MRYRKLGKTDIEVSTVAMGCWAIVGDGTWGPQDEADAVAAIQTALEVGINFFDTAPAYGGGASEQLLGRALGKQRNNAIIATKVSPSHLRPDDLMGSCEQSLRDLGTDHIDVLQVHWPNWEIPFADTYGGLDRLKQQGKIRSIGVSNFGPVDLAQAVGIGPIDVNQMVYSLIGRQLEFEVQPLCKQHGVSILPYSPMAQGLLTGKFATGADVPEGRARTRHFDPARHPQARHGEAGCEDATFTALDGVRSVAGRVGCGMAELSLAWLLHQDQVTSVLAGARSPQQVRDNAAAAERSLTADTLAELAEITEPVKQALGRNVDMWLPAERSRSR